MAVYGNLYISPRRSAYPAKQNRIIFLFFSLTAFIRFFAGAGYCSCVRQRYAFREGYHGQGFCPVQGFKGFSPGQVYKGHYSGEAVEGYGCGPFCR